MHNSVRSASAQFKVSLLKGLHKMDIETIQSAISSLKVAYDITRGALRSKLNAEAQQTFIDLQTAIIEAQKSAISSHADQSAMIEEIRNLKEELARVKAWDTEKARYELNELGPGLFAYSLKEVMAQGEPPHWICCACHGQGRKSALQNDGEFAGTSSYSCHKCGSKLQFDSVVSPKF